VAELAGNLSPIEAFELLRDDSEAVLVDCRTAAEWHYVGVPDLAGLGRAVATVEWVDFPVGARNPRFEEQLRGAATSTRAPVIFLCRSGVRSLDAAAAATAIGYARAYNVLGGFEGQLDGAGHRGVGGWKAAGLPWRQS
jgi:rhodanese-related sulfurtransferase